MPSRGLWFLLLSLVVSACDRAPQVEPSVTELVVLPGCEVERGCRARGDSITVNVQFGIAPWALRPFPVSLQVVGGRQVEQVSVTFYMQGMEMGVNRYRLVGNAISGWKADITLPICLSGRSDWIARFELITDRGALQFSIPFVLQKT